MSEFDSAAFPKLRQQVTRSAALMCMSLALTLACKKKETDVTKNRALRALSASSPRIELPVQGFAKSVVWVPLGAKVPRPIVVGLHGAHESAAATCERLRGIAGTQVFVICPQGPAPRFALLDPGTTSNELRAALTALKARFPAHVVKGSVVLVGFDIGADHAAHIAREEPAFFARVVLVNGGVAAWSATHASVFGQRGGSKLLILCTSQACVDTAELQAVFTRRAGADARVILAEGASSADAGLPRTLRREWAWLVQGENRWQARR